MSTDFNEQVNQLFVRGCRANNIIYYVDEIKLTSQPNLPRTSIRSMSYYLGGVPAKYGDTTGGVVVLKTKSYFDLYYDWKENY
jgi:hypothetical protein